MDLSLLAAHLVPAIRKDMSAPVVPNGTLSTAGRAGVLTAPEVLKALQGLEEETKERAEAKEVGKRAREQ